LYKTAKTTIYHVHLKQGSQTQIAPWAKRGLKM